MDEISEAIFQAIQEVAESGAPTMLEAETNYGRVVIMLGLVGGPQKAPEGESVQ